MKQFHANLTPKDYAMMRAIMLARPELGNLTAVVRAGIYLLGRREGLTSANIAKKNSENTFAPQPIGVDHDTTNVANNPIGTE